MTTNQRISAYDSASAQYHRAFDVFLANTDQKIRAREWLNGLVGGLRSRRLFVDAGAGNGKVTAWFVGDFQRTVAIEPNRSLFDELRRACPTAEVLRQKIVEAEPADLADLVLCSHILYYIDAAEWMANLEKLVSWLAPDGVLVVVVQNHETDCMRMLNHFFGYRFNLPELANRFAALHGHRYRVGLSTVPAQVATANFDSALTIAEFMLNLLPMPDPPARRSLEEYMRQHLSDGAGGFRFSCDQDFLTIRPRA
jgi:SAM-dependent methyltransferase